MRGCGGRHQASRSPWLCRGKIYASLNPSPGWTRDLKARRFFPCVKNTSPCVEPLNTHDFLISAYPSSVTHLQFLIVSGNVMTLLVGLVAHLDPRAPQGPGNTTLNRTH